MLNMTLAPDAAVDLHMHTTYSDGRWPAERLINYLVDEHYELVSVTDHDRVDMVASIVALAAEKGLAVLPGVEMSTDWKGKMGHMLCYGFDAEQNYLTEVTEGVVRKQLENTHVVHDELVKRGYTFPREEEVLAENGGKLRRPVDNALLLREHGHVSDWRTAMRMIHEAGFYSVHADMAEAVEAAHRSGAVCLIAHPGRREGGFTFYAPALLDQLRADVAIDGIEVYHPYHDAQIIEAYLEYVDKHNLLMSTGSDSHCMPGRMPMKYRAEISRNLLERVGIHIQ